MQQPFNPINAATSLDDHTRQRYLEEERARMRVYEEQRQQQAAQGASGVFIGYYHVHI